MFFFQAEDGIRDLVRSRGLGDVYKRQGNDNGKVLKKQKKKSGNFTIPGILPTFFHSKLKSKKVSINPVSYTHLTLPTSDLV